MCILIFSTAFFTWIPNVVSVIAISGFMFGFGLAAGPITWVYLADILPEYGVSFCVSSVWVWTTLNAFLFNYIVASIGISFTFLIFIICTLMCIVFIIFKLKETKDKT